MFGRHWEFNVMLNLYEQFRQLLPDAPLQVGTVIDSGSGVITVQLPGGGLTKARGVATVSQRVFIRNSQLESIAPTLTLEMIDI